MKICLLASAFRPYSNSGADVAVENTVDGLLQLGHEVSVITVGYWLGFKSLWPQAEELKVAKGKLMVYRYYPFNLFSFLTINSRPAWLRLPWHGLDMLNLHAYIVARCILKKIRPQLVLTHNLKGLGYSSIRAASAYSRKFTARHVHTLHDVQLVVPSGRLIKGEEQAWQNKFWLTRLYGSINRWLFSSPQVVVSASQFLLDFYVERGFFQHSKRVVLLNPLRPVLQLSPAPQKTDQLHFLYLGQIESHKGIIFLIDTFKKFLTKWPRRVTLLVVGSGALLADIKNSAQGYEEIIVSGAVPHRQLPEVFSGIDATIFPSLCYENSPTIIGESMSFGVPVIAAQIGGVQLVQHGVNGYIFEAGDSEDLLKVLEHCLNRRDELFALRPAAANTVKGLDIDSYLKKLLVL